MFSILISSKKLVYEIKVDTSFFFLSIGEYCGRQLGHAPFDITKSNNELLSYRSIWIELLRIPSFNGLKARATVKALFLGCSGLDRHTGHFVLAYFIPRIYVSMCFPSKRYRFTTLLGVKYLWNFNVTFCMLLLIIL